MSSNENGLEGEIDMFPRRWKRRVEKKQSFDHVMRPKFEVVASQNEASKYEFKQTSGENYTEKEPEKKEKLEASDIIKCPKCKKEISRKKAMRKKYVCYECGSYFRVKTNNRIRMVADYGTFEPWFADMPIKNPLDFPDYENKIKEARDKTGLNEAFTVGKATIFGEPCVIGICDSRFMMSSMGYNVGEKVTAAFERATEMRLPVFLFCCSGGARMQEGIVSLMQMAKTSGAVKRHSESGNLYCSILTDPTTGGVTASFAMLGDVILAEPGALVGFAGPRVIKQTIGQDLPEGFQTAEFLASHGIIDGVVQREDLKKVMYHMIMSHKYNDSYANFVKNEEYKVNEIVKERAAKSKPLTAWQKIKESRSPERPSAMDYIDNIFDYFIEAHGDRRSGDDGAIVGGYAFLDGQPVTVIAEYKGRTPQEYPERNFGMPNPEGYRKAMRLMEEAERFHRPIINFVNTPGAFPGIEAEERGQGEAIARNLYGMSGLKVPVLSILIGEGGSGGALALAVGNEVWILENATYSILSPEGFASILWKDSSRAEEASEVMKITADNLKELGIVERIIPEFGGADKNTVVAIAKEMKVHMKEFLKGFDGMSPEEIAEQRYKRFRHM